MKVNIKKLHVDAIIPTYAKDGDAGMDLTAVGYEYDKYGNITYYTGISMEIPKGYVGLIFPRSSIVKQTLTLANSVGVIDSGYRGEILIKFKPSRVFGIYGIDCPESYSSKEYQRGDRVAQIIIMPIPLIEFNEVSELGNSERGIGGFGSSGT